MATISNKNILQAWVRKLIGKLGVPYNRRLRVRGSPHPHVFFKPAAVFSGLISEASQNLFHYLARWTPVRRSHIH
jgi:hypothetical protein